MGLSRRSSRSAPSSPGAVPPGRNPNVNSLTHRVAVRLGLQEPTPISYLLGRVFHHYCRRERAPPTTCRCRLCGPWTGLAKFDEPQFHARVELVHLAVEVCEPFLDYC